MSNAFKCPGCNTATWGDLNFCPKCGCSLNIECQKCGYTIRYIYVKSYKFCPNCGEQMSNDRNKPLKKKGETK